MTTSALPTTITSRTTWKVLREIIAGIDAAARIAHGHSPTDSHPARLRERDRADLAVRLATRYPRT